METNNIYGVYKEADIHNELFKVDKQTADEITARIDKEILLNKNPNILKKTKDFLTTKGSMRNELDNDIKIWFLTRCSNFLKQATNEKIDPLYRKLIEFLFENYVIVYRKIDDIYEVVVIQADIMLIE